MFPLAAIYSTNKGGLQNFQAGFIGRPVLELERGLRNKPVWK
jgi:hypothetical protein